jgi:hypothetical protein
MKFLTVAALIASGITLAVATDYKPCQSTIYSSPQCCATDALGIVGIDCKVRKYTLLQEWLGKTFCNLFGCLGLMICSANFPPLDPGHFRRICAESGQQAKCCVLPVVSIFTFWVLDVR